jgi:hypothetical protein
MSAKTVREHPPTGKRSKGLRPAHQEHAFILVREPKLYGCICQAVFRGSSKREAAEQFAHHMAAYEDRANELEQSHAFGDAGELWEFQP